MTKYYVVLPLPLNVLLIFYQAFSEQEDAENFVLHKLSWFSVWTLDQINKWSGRKIYIPFRDAKKKDNVYFLDIQVLIKTTDSFSTVEADVRQTLAQSSTKMNGINIKLMKERTHIESLD